MSNSQDIQQLLRAWLKSVADKAQEDSLKDESSIGSIYHEAEINLEGLTEQDLDQISKDIEQATRTKEGSRRLINALASVARVIVKLYPS
jgi:hypothetical protein